jgi:hypothetical protein
LPQARVFIGFLKSNAMKIGIMQPYFLPYLGYFQIMKACDKYVVYDNIQFTKKGWIHRNRMLLNGKDALFSLPLKNDSDYLNIDQRALADTFDKEKNKILGQIKSAYGKAPQFKTAYPVIESIFNHPDTNLFGYIYHAISAIKDYLRIDTPLVVSSGISMNHELKGKYRVMEIVKQLGGDTYINPIGGVELYDKQEFTDNGIALHFHKMQTVVYPQFKNDFVPYLSILDLMMFVDRDELIGLLDRFDFV